MLDRTNGAMVDRHAAAEATTPPLGCRTLCGTCQQPIEVVRPTFPGGDPFWSHVEQWDGPYHRATPVEQPEPAELVPATRSCRECESSPGQQLTASVEASVAAYQRGRAEGIAAFAAHLRGMAQRGGNERITDSLLSIADIADRYALGQS